MNYSEYYNTKNHIKRDFEPKEKEEKQDEGIRD